MVLKYFYDRTKERNDFERADRLNKIEIKRHEDECNEMGESIKDMWKAYDAYEKDVTA